MKLNFLLKSCRRLLSSCRAGGCAALRYSNTYQKNMNGACSNMHRTLTSGCLRLMLQSNTGAGRNSFFGRSLHHLGQHPGADLNPYEQAIRIIGNTLAIFDEDQLIPAYAFGDGEASRTRRLLCMHGRAACRPLLHSHWFMCHCCEHSTLQHCSIALAQDGGSTHSCIKQHHTATAWLKCLRHVIPASHCCCCTTWHKLAAAVAAAAHPTTCVHACCHCSQLPGQPRLLLQAW